MTTLVQAYNNYHVYMEYCFSLILCGFAVYYYYLVRSKVSKVLFAVAIISFMRDITAYIMDKPYIFDHPGVEIAFRVLQLILSLVVAVAFFKLYKKNVDDFDKRKTSQVNEG